MKIYSLALIFALAAAQDDAATEPAAEELTPEEPADEEVEKFGGDLTWDTEDDLVEGVAGTFSANVTYMEDADGMVAVETSAEGTWGDVWPDVKKNASKYNGGILLVFRQEMTEDDITTVKQEGWMGIGTRDAAGNNEGTVSATWEQANFAADFTYNTFLWDAAPAADELDTESLAPNWTDGSISFPASVDGNFAGVSGSANRAGTGSNSSFKDGEYVTVWGGVWATESDETTGGHWGSATMMWDLEKPELPVKVIEEVVEGASSLAMTALAGAAIAALAF